MLLQVVDFLELNKCYGCLLQLGGGDQWGNIINGVELCCCIVGNEVSVFIILLIMIVFGVKMGKIVDGVVWFNDDMLFLYEYWQFWCNIEDVDVGCFLCLFIDLLLDEIVVLEVLEGVVINDVKVCLVNEVIIMLYGVDVVCEVEVIVKVIFVAGGVGDVLLIVEVMNLIGGDVMLVLLFVEVGLVVFNGEMKCYIKVGVVKVNGQVLIDIQVKVVVDYVVDGVIKLLIGKKWYVLVKFVQGFFIMLVLLGLVVFLVIGLMVLFVFFNVLS